MVGLEWYPCCRLKPVRVKRRSQFSIIFVFASQYRTECERYWEARTKMMENWLRLFTITIFVTTSYH